MKHPFDLLPTEFCSLLQTRFDELQSHAPMSQLSSEGVQSLLYFYNESHPARCREITFNYMTKQPADLSLVPKEMLYYYPEFTWSQRFRVLELVGKMYTIPLHYAAKLHTRLMKVRRFLRRQKNFVIGPNPFANEDPERKYLCTVKITILHRKEIIVQFKSTDLESTEPRSRLCRKFGSDSFIIVKFIADPLSLSDKIEIQKRGREKSKNLQSEKDKTRERSRNLNCRRLYNLLIQPDERREEFGEVPFLISEREIQQTLRAERIVRHYDILGAFQQLTQKPLYVAGKKFQFFTVTNTGIHNQKCIFTSVDRQQICDWVFKPCEENSELMKNPLKYALRISMLNSNSVQTLSTTNVCVEDDVLGTNSDNPDASENILSDGCGKISRSFAERVRVEYNARSRPVLQVPKRTVHESDGTYNHTASKVSLSDEMKDLPAAFQIRYGSCKGMLVVTDDSLMDGYDIKFTKSMKKFEAADEPEHHFLEIMGFSSPSTPITTNSEMLDVLVGCAIDSDGMRQFLSTLLSHILKSTEILLRYRQKLFMNSVAENDFIALSMIGAGLSNADVFLAGFYRRELRPLRIPIPMSCRLYGIADFSGKLQQGQIFVKNGNSNPLNGKVVLLKEPCFQRTDLRVFDAIDIPELHHLQNVVVFSTCCDYSDPSLMAGSDLDGDKFVCIWAPGIINNIKPYESVDQTYEPKKNIPIASKDHKDIFEEVRKYFIQANHNLDYCSLAELLNLRIRHTDAESDNWTESPKCIHLGQLLTSTIDAPKNGTWVPVKEAANLVNAEILPHYHPASRLSFPRSESVSIRTMLTKMVDEWASEYTGTFTGHYTKRNIEEYTFSEILHRFTSEYESTNWKDTSEYESTNWEDPSENLYHYGLEKCFFCGLRLQVLLCVSLFWKLHVNEKLSSCKDEVKNFIVPCDIRKIDPDVLREMQDCIANKKLFKVQKGYLHDSNLDTIMSVLERKLGIPTMDKKLDEQLTHPVDIYKRAGDSQSSNMRIWNAFRCDEFYTPDYTLGLPYSIRFKELLLAKKTYNDTNPVVEKVDKKTIEEEQEKIRKLVSDYSVNEVDESFVERVNTAIEFIQKTPYHELINRPVSHTVMLAGYRDSTDPHWFHPFIVALYHTGFGYQWNSICKRLIVFKHTS